MKSTRIKQINELIKRELGTIFSREVDLPEGSLMTIIKVETSSDLNEAKIWISVYPFSLAQGVLKDLKKRMNYFRKLLGKRLKSLNTLPRIRLFLDQTEEKVEKVAEALDKINKR